MAAQKTQYLRFLFFAGIIVGLSVVVSPVLAQISSVKKISKNNVRDKGQTAIIIVDGAAIYDAANFDSPVMDYLERNKKVLISKKVYSGTGGLGSFYKIRMRKGVFGYVTDVDVQVVKKSGSNEADKSVPSEEPDDEMDPTKLQSSLEDAEVNEDGADGETGINSKRYLGLGFNQTNYSETIANQTKSSNTSMITIKMSGPGKSMGGLPLDYELAFTTSAPDFYNTPFSSAKGFLLIGHAMTIFPLAQFKSSMIYYGFGLMSKFSLFDVVMRNNTNKAPVDSQELTLGIAGQIGYAHTLSKRYCVRLDGKYYYEKEAYHSLGAALQMQY